MPIFTSRLLVLKISITDFLVKLEQLPNPPIFIAKVVHWAFRPTKFSAKELLEGNPAWDILLITDGPLSLPEHLQELISLEWNVTSELVCTDPLFKKLMISRPPKIDPLTRSWDAPIPASTSDHNPLELRLTKETQDWAREFGEQEGHGELTVLNLVAYKPEGKTQYMKYIEGYVRSAGARRGGRAKMVGDVICCSTTPTGTREWKEMILAQYPSIYHFVEMIASEDYRELDTKYRADNLDDALILCTTELNLPGE